MKRKIRKNKKSNRVRRLSKLRDCSFENPNDGERIQKKFEQ